ncbi:glucuronate isomerase [Rubritalea squalenifaciens DSM 18772]|uniref:Uronate isomerase n=1 Tax=Rubritalea squalenifaciens DSM 18772 TaxID=1123071 RepID=A0A1M6B8W9_9BACT|nr:glucuronate isomerase [Rubritalea squalenifaciens]SHI45191.1 glucuronate isomerase [Rubritalea squalenifaciens DSM 18772]
MLLTSKLAEQIYASIADAPIIDFHTHLPQQEIYDDHRFADLWELWLKHDHYKWRLMRGCGVDEQFITGDAEPFEKFKAFAGILPLAIGNPVYQWAHMELEAVFGITTALNADSAETIWNQANQALENDPQLSVRGLLEKFKVKLVCTTDDPTWDLSIHEKLATEDGLYTTVLPTFRPDRFLSPHQPEKFQHAIADLAKCVGFKIESFDDLVTALAKRHAAFHAAGCRMSDHGLPYCPTQPSSEFNLEEIFSRSMSGTIASEDEWNAFAAALMQHIAKLNTEKGWTMQLHLGPLRNVNSRMALELTADSGFDTMGSWPQTEPLVAFLDQLSFTDSLPKTIVYNLNPNESEAICCALQNFQCAPTPGKIQYGPAWWHCDHVRGIREQIDILTCLGAIGTSIGMLTDSRSFTSYVRHDYYRRILCSYLADAANKGEMPNDLELLSTTARNIAHCNAESYLELFLTSDSLLAATLEN